MPKGSEQNVYDKICWVQILMIWTPTFATIGSLAMASQIAFVYSKVFNEILVPPSI